MKDSKTLRLLTSLTLWEQKRLDVYLKSPFFCKNTQVQALWDLLKTYAPDFQDEALSMEVCFRHLFPAEAYSAARIRYLLTDLTQLIEGFLAYVQGEKKGVYPALLLHEALDERGLLKERDRLGKKLQTQWTQQPPRNTQDLASRLALTEQRFLCDPISQDTNYDLPQLIAALDDFYVAKKLRYTAEWLNRSRQAASLEGQLLIPALMEERLSTHGEGRLGRLYQWVLLTLAQPAEETHYHRLKAELAESLDILDQDELQHLYNFALNYCIKQLNTGKGAYRREIFELYQLLIEHKIIFQQNQLPEAHYKNVVAIGSRLQEFSWTEKFINQYQSFLPEEVQENAYRYNKAFLLLAQGAYKQVLRLIATVEFTNLFYQLGAKTMLIKTYYELEDFDGLHYLLGSFKVYLKRHKKISDYQRKLYLNLIRVSNLLVRYQLGEDVQAQHFEQHWASFPNTASPDWVRQKIATLQLD
ncbi:MAG: hypothetical protein AAFR61_22575 [Bacteroidota bacterium]